MGNQEQSVQTITVREKNGKTFLTSTYNKSLLAVGALLPAFAFADGIDVSTGVTQLGYALAAIGAIGAAKLAPSAIMWVWGLVTSGARRG